LPQNEGYDGKSAPDYENLDCGVAIHEPQQKPKIFTTSRGFELIAIFENLP
jgi:hypothetical protein